jgi:hypothetical protein
MVQSRKGRTQLAQTLTENEMKRDGMHRVTCITADAPRNADFYVRVLGLRITKQSVNQTDPTNAELRAGLLARRRAALA